MNEKCRYELGVLLQAISFCEDQVEKGRYALNILPFYSPDLGFSILSNRCAGGLVTFHDLLDFLG